MEETEPTAITAGPPELPTAPLETLDEFSDRLSPMLVKELRQGLRTPTFTIVFLTLQGLLTTVLLIAGAASSGASSDGAGDIVSKVVFCFYAFAVLVIQPLRGISTLSSEIKGKTIDLMVLTRLSAWRIVWGKWLSIASQTGLILLAVLPYLMLRYFFGGMQLFSELFLMLYLFAISGTLTAFTIGISGLGSALIRGIVVVAGGIGLGIWVLFGFTPQLDTFVNALSLTSPATFFLALGLLALITYIGYFFLELGTSFIAPAAENRATRKRIIGLVVGVLAFLGVQFENLSLAVGAAGLVGILLSFDLFSEKPGFPAVVVRPFLKLGPLGRFLGRSLYPGWPTGVLFFLLYAGLITGLLYAITSTRGSDPQAWAIAGIAFGIMTFPAAMIQIFARKTANRHGTYLGISIMGWLLAVILTVIFEQVNEELLLVVFSVIPMVQIPLLGELWSTIDQKTFTILIWCVSGFYFLLNFAFALPHLKKITALEEEELDLWEGGQDHDA